MSDTPARDELPIPDYDHLPVAALGHRIRSLTADQLDAVIRYEEAHGNRLPVLQVLRTRAEDLAGGAEPSGGDAAAGLLQQSPGMQGTGPVTKATTGPETVGPAHGDPTNPVPDPRTP